MFLAYRIRGVDLLVPYPLSLPFPGVWICLCICATKWSSSVCRYICTSKGAYTYAYVDENAYIDI